MFYPDRAQVFVTRILGGAMLGALLLAACGGPRTSTTTPPAGTTSGPATAVALDSSRMAASGAPSADSTLADTSGDDGDAATRELEEAIERQSALPAWAPKKHRFNPSRERRWDLLHTQLDARLDFPRRELSGTVRLDLTPFFYAQDSLWLDAKGMLIHRLERVTATGKRPLTFAYTDSVVLSIAMGGRVKKGEKLTIEIAYTARPDLRPNTGSDAIAGDKGLYFINPDGTHPRKPRQVWTQGETEATSVWCPTIDSPNERCTQQLSLTVPDSMATLSNGLKTATRRNADGTRTDTWVMTQPHAPYLFMLAAGRFAVIKDQWRGKEVSYYVEPKHAGDARGIFGKTPQMIEFYSTRLGTPYPWPKYSQIVIRDFVSGAMENTTAVTFYDGVLRDRRARLDGDAEDIISHELFHHWFGDLVTCESWANLPLNESFATYGEYLWFEHSRGRMDADRHLRSDLKTYLVEANEKREPLIRYYYADREDMFDRHSYQKGGRVLHYLRYLVGDEAFFAALQLYLKTHAYQSVEIHDLRQAFEATTGRDLQAFFEQWFLSAGHPEIETDYDYYPDSRRLQIAIEQVQDRSLQPLYTLPMQIEVAWLQEGRLQRRRVPVVITSADTTLSVALDYPPLYVDVDADKAIPGLLKEDKPLEAWVAQLAHAQGYGQLADALEALADTVHPQARRAIAEATRHPYWGVRAEAISAFDAKHFDAAGDSLLDVFLSLSTDAHAQVRSAAAERLAVLAERATSVASPEVSADPTMAPKLTLSAADRDRLTAALVRLASDSSYAATAAALAGLYKLKPSAALDAAKRNLNADSPDVLTALSIILMNERSENALDFALKTVERIESDFNAYALIQQLGQYLVEADPTQQERGIGYLKQCAEANPIWYLRLAAMQGLANFREREDIRTFMQGVVQREKNPRLRAMYLGGQ